MATILEALQNAKYNLIDNKGISLAGIIGRTQLDNAVTLLEKGYGLRDDVEPLLEEFGDVKDVPDKH